MLLHSVHGADGLVVAVGDNGALYHVRHGLPVKVHSGTAAHLHAVHVLHQRFAVAVGAGGTVLLWGGKGWQELPRLGPDDLHSVHVLDEHDLLVGGLQRLYRHDGVRLVSQGDSDAPVSGLWASGPGDVWLVAGDAVFHLTGPRDARRHTPAAGAGPLFAVAGGAPDAPVVVAGAGGVWRWEHPVWRSLDGAELGPVYGCSSSLDGDTVYAVTAGGELREWSAARGSWRTLFTAPGSLEGCWLDEPHGVLWLAGEGLFQHRIGAARPVALRPAALAGHATAP